ncbi:hypothetical protein [Haloactinomyces albus]|uniref:Uncharacterized protein n=1 Tax=Haloactinomyces albus TaxID=1352928 RepID=A0AAE4CMQ3_9ACTN|nr:hypothetical protein [Haloactinomyces albus]MDR7303099.1 hypothetical protein [Haloactinomyces albus]
MDRTRQETSAEGAAHGAGHGGRDRTGEELRWLLDALAFRAEEYLLGLGRGPDEQAGGADTAADERLRCSSAGTCEWCPLCAAMSFLRGDRPELATRMSEHLAGLVTVLRRILAEQDDSPRDAERTRPETANGFSPEPGPDNDAPPVQRIGVQRVHGSVLRPSEGEVRAEGHGC